MVKTPLYEEHIKLGAKIVDFAGFDLPVYYDSIKEEHLAVRNEVGMFDVTHMGVVELAIDAPISACEQSLLRKISDLNEGQIRYNRIINDTNGVVDDILVYKLEGRYLAVFNGINISKNIDFFRSKGLTWKIKDLHIIAVQGPKAIAKLSETMGSAGKNLVSLKYYSVGKFSLFEEDMLISRTGYTGEDGLELMIPKAKCSKVWQNLMELGIRPCGLGARDSLRVEAGMPLYGHELKDDWTSQYSDTALGLKLLERGTMQDGCEIFEGDKKVGMVTSAAYSPTTNEAIAIFIPTEFFSDNNVEVVVRGKRKKAVAQNLPFIKKER